MTVEEKAVAVTKLYANKEFQDLIIGDYIDSSIHRLCLQENVDNESVRDELKARRIFNDYLYSIIEEAEISKSEDKLD